MDERDALLTVAVRAVETADRERRTWTDEDRAWASRAAAEVLGEAASPASFVAQRARLAWERLRGRDVAFARAVEGLRWRPAVGGGLLVAALAAGLAIDRIGSGQRINLLAPPVFGVLVWNLAVYLGLIGGFAFGLAARRRAAPRPTADAAPAMRADERRGKPPGDAAEVAPTPEAPPRTGVLRRLLVTLAAGAGRWSPRRAGSLSESLAESALSRVLVDWSRIAAPLHAARAARLLHCAAALFAVGLIAGFYLRGIAFEYRAGWESTFLSPAAVHTVLGWLLAPGLWLTGQTLPEVAGLRFAASSPGENAAPWLHLLAATLLVVVVVPRLLLGAAGALAERRRARQLVADLAAPYFQALMRDYQAAPLRLTVVPYSYHPSTAAIDGLRQVATRVFGGNATLVCLAPVGYGDEDGLPAASRPAGGGPTFALFNLAATPEREAQGAFVGALRAGLTGAPLLALVDEGPWRARFAAGDGRLGERRAAWQVGLGEFGLAPVFVDLAQPDLGGVQAAIEGVLEPRR